MRLVGTVGVALIVCAAAGATDRTTKLRVYFPNGHVGHVVDGSCAGGSLATPRVNAWRCVGANQIYDPCFSTGPHAKTVNCPKSPWLRAFVTQIRLAKPLPAVRSGGDPKRALPWAIKLFNGAVCTKFLGTRGVIAHKRATYGCTDRRTTLLNGPARARSLWTIAAAVGTRPPRIGRFAIQEAVW